MALCQGLYGKVTALSRIVWVFIAVEDGILSASLLPMEFVCHLFLDIILSSLLLLCHQESNRELTKIQTQRPARTQSLEPSPGESKGPTVCFPCFLRSRGQGPGQIRDAPTEGSRNSAAGGDLP